MSCNLTKPTALVTPGLPQPAKLMTARERGDLCQIIRQRERLAKTAAAQLRADFEKQLQTHYSYDQDEVWREAHKAAEQVTRNSVSPRDVANVAFPTASHPVFLSIGMGPASAL